MEKNNSEIPIVFASNDAYAPYLAVAIYSLVFHTTEKHRYSIYVLEGGINEIHKNRMLKLTEGYANITIEFIDVSSQMENYVINIGSPHVTKETAYRLLIDRILPEHDKVIYMDCDLVVNHDVAELYQYDLEDNIAGACAAKMPVGFEEYIDKELHLNCEQYFNSGVMLFNIPAFAEEQLGRKGLEMLGEKTYTIQEQDVLNILCHGRVKYLDKRWNVRCGVIEDKALYEKEAVDEMRGYLKNPYIVHFSSARKPWAHPENEAADFFWKYARETAFFEEILMRNLKLPVKQNVMEDAFSRFIFPWKCAKPSSRIIIYGGGVVGHAFLRQIERTDYCKVLAVCDRKPENINDVSVPVITVAELSQFDYDNIVIAIENEKTAGTIRLSLRKEGVPDEKIQWKSPNR